MESIGVLNGWWTPPEAYHSKRNDGSHSPSSEARGGVARPFKRTTGMRIDVDVEYSNKIDGRAQFYNDNVRHSNQAIPTRLVSLTPRASLPMRRD